MPSAWFARLVSCFAGDAAGFSLPHRDECDEAPEAHNQPAQEGPGHDNFPFRHRLKDQETPEKREDQNRDATCDGPRREVAAG
jgi:hypothetical protein